MDGYRGRYPQIQGGGFYNPYSKHPNWGGGIKEFIQNLTAFKEWKALQAQRRQAREQEMWRRGITERELKLREKQAAKPLKPTKLDFQRAYTEYNVQTKQWTEDEGRAYLATGNVPEKSSVLPPAIQSNIMEAHKIKDWNKVSPKQQAKLLEDYLIRTRPKAGKEKLTPEEQQRDITVKKQGNLVKAAQKRIESLMKPLLSKAKVLASEQHIPPSQDTLEARVAVENFNQVVDLLQKVTSSSLASGRPLMPEYEKAVRKAMKASKEDIGSGKLYQDIMSSWQEQLQEFKLGQKRQDKDGNTWEYIGNDQWRLIK